MCRKPVGTLDQDAETGHAVAVLLLIDREAPATRPPQLLAESPLIGNRVCHHGAQWMRSEIRIQRRILKRRQQHLARRAGVGILGKPEPQPSTFTACAPSIEPTTTTWSWRQTPRSAVLSVDSANCRNGASSEVVTGSSP